MWGESDLVIKVRPPATHPSGGHEADMLREGGTLISFIWPGENKALVSRLEARKATVLAMDCVPRITRAQKLDALSSMANIAGYRSVIEAAQHFGRFFTGQMTAAGKVPPARVLVVGAGVAGLAAIGAARGLGAIVRAFDTRPVVKAQIESMGAEFLTVEFEEDGTGAGGYAKQMSDAFIEAEHRLFEAQAREVDIIITTALIPGKKAPELITKDMVDSMKPGSIVVDLAAEQGGNCGYTQPDRAVEVGGVTVLGYTDLTSRLATQSSQLFGTNLVNLLSDMMIDGECQIDMEDEVVRKSLVLRDGVVTWPPPPDPEKAVAPPPTDEVPKPPPTPEPAPAKAKADEKGSSSWPMLLAAAMGAFAVYVGMDPSQSDFVQRLTVFVLACFVGWQVVWNVTAALHTPLMSVTNAISGIIIVGGMLQAGNAEADQAAQVLGAIAILVASINIAGGFLVTQRMLAMFRK